MGHAKTTITIGKISASGSARLICMVEPNLGGRNFDWALMEVISTQFKDEYDFSENPMDMIK